MSGFGGSCMARIACALPLVAALELGCSCCGNPTPSPYPRTFPINQAEAVQIFDAHGQPMPGACASLCDRVAQRTLAPTDASSDPDAGTFLFEGRALTCEVVSTGRTLALACYYPEPCAL